MIPEDFDSTAKLYGPPPVSFYEEFKDMKLCSHLRAKLEYGGEYDALVKELRRDPEVTFKAINRQLHVYKEGKKILILTGRSGIKELNK
ncbi:MAG: hypothetical protein MJZ22_04800 [Candidatus Saccharibacteria bacterium]|nr:hypothetical protein [Candidatus Saccharibacteria bacterium]